MAGTVKGITVEIGGDTTKLGKALETSEKQSRALQKELTQVNTALKFNPDNVELLTKKQKILTDQIQATKEKLDLLKSAEAQVTAQFKAGEIGEEQFREFQREIVTTESKLKSYQSQLEATGKKASALDQLTDKMSEQEAELVSLKNEYKNAVLMYGKNSDEAKALASQIDTLSSELKENKDKMTELDKAADDLDNSLEDADDGARKASEGFTVLKGVLANLATKVIVETVRGVTDLAKKTLDAGMNFESGMSKVAAVSGATGDDLERLTEKAQEMGAKTKFSASESAEAFNYMAMAGWKTEDMLNGIEGIMILAAASGADLATTSDIVTDALTAMGYEAKDAGKLADVMAAASSNANTNVEMMGKTFQYAAPIVGALGFSMEDTAVAIGLMANAGIKADKAGTALRSVLTRLSAPPKECATAMEDLGISLTDNEGNMKSLDAVMGDLRKAFKGLSSTQQTQYAKSIAGQEAMSGLLAIVNAAPEDYEKLTKAVNESNGAAQEMADQMNDNVAGALTLLKSNVESKMIKVFDNAKGSIKDSVRSMSAALDSLDWDKISEDVGELAEAVAQLFNYVVKHSDEVISALKLVGGVLTTIFAVKKVAELISALETLKGAFTVLWGVLMANPVTLVVAGLGALAAAMVVLKKRSDDAIAAQYGLNDAQEQSISASHRLKEEYDELDRSRKESLDAIDKEYDYLGELKDEYNSLIDSNGEVKEGYEDRANFIVNQLAEALGLEREEILKNVDANGKLGDSIDQLIVKKQAEATLAATEDAYTQAIQKRNEALDVYMNAQKTYGETEKKYQDSVALSGDVLSEYNRLLREAPSYADKYYWSNQEVIKGQQEAKDAYEAAKSALSDAESAYVGYNATIENYEGLSSAIISGDTEKIRVALENSQINFITAETGTKESLERQVQNLKDNYVLMKEAVEQGTPGITQAQVDAAAEMVKKAEEELDKLPPVAEKSGEKAGSSHAEGLLSAGTQIKKAGEKIASDANAAMGTADTTATGDTKGKEYAAGIDGTAKEGEKAGQTVAQETDKGLGSPDTKATGTKKGTEYATGVRNTFHNAVAAGKTIGDGAKSGAGSVDTTKTGQKTGSLYVGGVKSKQGEAKAAGTSLGNEAKAGAGSVSAYSSGQNFGQGFINGIGSLFGAVWRKAKELALRAWEGLRAGQQEGSPSKLTYQSGVYFDEGYINAIRDKAKGAVKAAQEMARNAVDALRGKDDPDFDPNYPGFNGSTFNRQLNSTFSGDPHAVNLTAILDRLDRLEDSIRGIKNTIVLDTGVLVGETINKIDSGLADVYDLKARGV